MMRYGLGLALASSLVLQSCGANVADAKSVGDWIVQPLNIEYRGADGQLAPQIIDYDVLCAPRETTAIKGSPLEGGDWVKTGGNPVQMTPFPKFAAFEVTDGILIVEPVCIGENVNEPNQIRRPQFIKTAMDQRLATRLYRVSDGAADPIIPIENFTDIDDPQMIHTMMMRTEPGAWQITYGAAEAVKTSDRKAHLMAAEEMRLKVDNAVDLYAALGQAYPSWRAIGYKTTRHSAKDDITKMALKLRASQDHD